MAELTEADKERCRYHMGYMETSQGASLSFGMARPVQTMFLLDQAMLLLQDQNAVNRVKCLLDTLDGIEEQMRRALKTLGVESLGSIKMRSGVAGQTFTDILEREYTRWAGRLADVLGAPRYGYSVRSRNSGPGMISRG
jgi:hypothetical protein